MVRVISRRVLFETIKPFADAMVAVQVWLDRVEDGDWESSDALRKDFLSARHGGASGNLQH